MKENPDKAEMLHKRLENFNQDLTKLSALRNEIDAATQEVQDKERKRKAAAVGV